MANNYTDLDIIRIVIKKRNFAQAYDLLQKKGQGHAKQLSSKQKQEDRNGQVKQALKLWVLMGKQVKQ